MYTGVVNWLNTHQSAILVVFTKLGITSSYCERVHELYVTTIHILFHVNINDDQRDDVHTLLTFC